MTLEQDSQLLRQLARAVMAGELTRDEYRRQRRVVIDRYAGDAPVATRPLSDVVEASPLPGGAEHTLPNTTPTVPYRQTDDITMMGGDRAQRKNPQPEAGAAAGAHNDLWIGIVAVAFVLLVVGGFLAYFW